MKKILYLMTSIVLSALFVFADISFAWGDCPAGQYIKGAGCLPCPAGFWCTGRRGDNPFQCEAGTYAEGTGNTSCTKCPAGTYADGEVNICISLCPHQQINKEIPL